ncbi:peptidase inhibitor family I36 protein [Streptomyces sp. N2-109]|uniref:Peptidase inhibitor family I36 protein n=1 Tax=Streptomyces gossypii TaxID=2883101 RepID=A0ABT2JP66_9ACTN|nr:peptidase inhibitor family I36 protein [Streptomyces gossypii]MCT2589518.1 peptidase inhibitor family I36 protein [Streptomyces gossypii]
MAWTPQVQAASSPEGGAVARYGQQKINLQQDGWRDARTCVVHSEADVCCVKTHAEADRTLGYSRASDPLLRNAKADAKALPACANGWLCLYENANGGGRRLIFSERQWHNLTEYDFNDKTPSWRNNQTDSAGYLARDLGGNGGSIALSAKSYSSNLGSYNDWAGSVAA